VGRLGLCWPGGSATRGVHLGELVACDLVRGFRLRIFKSDKGIPTSRMPILAAVGGSMVTRTSSKRAFQVEGRGLVTQDIIPYIAKAFTENFGEDVQAGEKGRL